MIVQLFCVCVMYIAQFMYMEMRLVLYKSKTLHTVEFQSYKVMECHECPTGVIL